MGETKGSTSVATTTNATALATSDPAANTKGVIETKAGGEAETVHDEYTPPVGIYIEAAWQAYRITMYEIERTKRTKNILSSMGGLRYMMRFKRKLFGKTMKGAELKAEGEAGTEQEGEGGWVSGLERPQC